MVTEIRSPGVTTRLIDEASGRLAALGYGSQVEKKQNEAHFFLYVNGKRRKVLFERGRYYLPEENSSLGPSEMEHICESEPGRFSPNVVLRPVVQSAILPTVDYVAGPGEVAYWAQLRAVFDQFGVLMPRVVPRPHAVLVTPRCAKLLARHNVDAADVVARGEVPSVGGSATSGSSSHEHALVETCAQISSQLERYVSEMEALDASLGKSAAKLQDKVGYELDKLNRKVRAAREERAEQAQGEMEELLANLLPSGKGQERVLNVFPYLMESGWTLVPRLIHTVDSGRTGYQIVTL
jgi:bacillithiol biosynthesis cysteine-adding enzyme BshC